MVKRHTLECHACGARTVTRTAIGHGDSQVHSFPCPGCGVGITYRVVLDQHEIRVEYDPKPENAKWLASEEGARYEVTFDSELLLPRYALTIPHLTPFIATAGFFRDIPKFQRQEAVRLHWRTNVWPIVNRLRVHYEAENWNLFDDDAKKLGDKPDGDTRLSRLNVLRRAHDVPLRWLLYPDSSGHARIAQRIALAKSISPQLVADLASQYLQTGRMAELWRQLHEFHGSLVRDFPFVSPMLQPKLYWRESPADLTSFVVCDKRFVELKPMYIDTFETFARMSVIAIACETIIHHSALTIPTRKGLVDLWSFEKLANANKPDHLDKYPITDLFSPYLDTALRNGIGHNAARYDAATDVVMWVKGTQGSLREEGVPYTVFCDRVLELASALARCESYFYFLLGEVEGTLR